MLQLPCRLIYGSLIQTFKWRLPLRVDALRCRNYVRTSQPLFILERHICCSVSCSRLTGIGKRYIFNSGVFKERQFRLCLSRQFASGVHQGNSRAQFNGVKANIKFRNRNTTTAIYVVAIGITVLGLSYAAVPLYRLYCQATGLGGTVKTGSTGEKIESMERKPERLLKIRFNADTSSTMRWKFKPQQSEVKLVPGETALAFYTATNPTDQPITGISTYNVIPFDAGQYFNKIQCFCFEEQRLNPHEQVDMPVFFYIDPEFTEDPAMARVDTITLSYTFFEAKEADELGI